MRTAVTLLVFLLVVIGVGWIVSKYSHCLKDGVILSLYIYMHIANFIIIIVGVPFCACANPLT
jgi:hypothetical protein